MTKTEQIFRKRRDLNTRNRIIRNHARAHVEAVGPCDYKHTIVPIEDI